MADCHLYYISSSFLDVIFNSAGSVSRSREPSSSTADTVMLTIALAKNSPGVTCNLTTDGSYHELDDCSTKTWRKLTIASKSYSWTMSLLTSIERDWSVVPA